MANPPGAASTFIASHDFRRFFLTSKPISLLSLSGMKFYRLFTGPDGQSHFEPLDTGVQSELLNVTRPATGLLLRNDFAPHIVNFHTAPRRRWVITLSGHVDIGLGDGTAMSFYPGDLFLAEDTSGQGHTATPHNWVRAYVNLD
jgi:hypothetical protein